MADLVEDGLALGGEVADSLSAGGSGSGDQAVEAGEVELEGLERELGRGGLEVAGSDDELGDQAGEGLVVGWEIRGGGADAAAEVLGGPTGHRGLEQLVEVGLGEAALALVGQGEAVGEERALGLLAAVQDAVRAAVALADARLGAGILEDGRTPFVRWWAVVSVGVTRRTTRRTAGRTQQRALTLTRRSCRRTPPRGIGDHRLDEARGHVQPVRDE